VPCYSFYLTDDAIAQTTTRVLDTVRGSIGIISHHVREFNVQVTKLGIEMDRTGFGSNTSQKKGGGKKKPKRSLAPLSVVLPWMLVAVSFQDGELDQRILLDGHSKVSTSNHRRL
jgi:hypothetical protein